MREQVTGGCQLTTVLLAIFVVLKLTDNIDWSWWWVLSPVWIPVGLFVVVFIVVAIFYTPFFFVREARRANFRT